MLFAGVVNAQQPTTATAQNIAHTPQDVHGTTPQVLGKDPAAGNDASAYGCGHGGHHYGGHHYGGHTMADIKLKPQRIRKVIQTTAARSEKQTVVGTVADIQGAVSPVASGSERQAER